MSATPATMAALSADTLRAAGLPVLSVREPSANESVIELEDPRGGTFTITVTGTGLGWNFLVSTRTVGDPGDGSWAYASIFDEQLRPEIIQVILDDLANKADR